MISFPLSLVRGSACDDAAQLFVRILGAIQGNSEAAHTVADQKYGNAGILGNRQIDYNVSVIQQFIKVRVIGALSLGTSVAAVIKAVGADSGLVEQPGKNSRTGPGVHTVRGQ